MGQLKEKVIKLHVSLAKVKAFLILSFPHPQLFSICFCFANFFWVPKNSLNSGILDKASLLCQVETQSPIFAHFASDLLSSRGKTEVTELKLDSYFTALCLV